MGVGRGGEGRSTWAPPPPPLETSSGSAPGPRKKPQDYNGNPNHVTSGLGFGLGWGRVGVAIRRGQRNPATVGMFNPLYVCLTVTAALVAVCASDGRRPSVLGRDRFLTKKIGLGLGLGLAGLVLCCETRSCHARRHNDLEGHSNFSSNIYIVSLICAWNITTVEINSGIYLLKS